MTIKHIIIQNSKKIWPKDLMCLSHTYCLKNYTYIIEKIVEEISETANLQVWNSIRKCEQVFFKKYPLIH